MVGEQLAGPSDRLEGWIATIPGQQSMEGWVVLKMCCPTGLKLRKISHQNATLRTHLIQVAQESGNRLCPATVLVLRLALCRVTHISWNWTNMDNCGQLWTRLLQCHGFKMQTAFARDFLAWIGWCPLGLRRGEAAWKKARHRSWFEFKMVPKMVI